MDQVGRMLRPDPRRVVQNNHHIVAPQQHVQILHHGPIGSIARRRHPPVEQRPARVQQPHHLGRVFLIPHGKHVQIEVLLRTLQKLPDAWPELGPHVHMTQVVQDRRHPLRLILLFLHPHHLMQLRRILLTQIRHPRRMQQRMVQIEHQQQLLPLQRLPLCRHLGPLHLRLTHLQPVMNIIQRHILRTLAPRRQPVASVPALELEKVLGAGRQVTPRPLPTLLQLGLRLLHAATDADTSHVSRMWRAIRLLCRLDLLQGSRCRRGRLPRIVPVAGVVALRGRRRGSARAVGQLLCQQRLKVIATATAACRRRRRPRHGWIQSFVRTQSLKWGEESPTPPRRTRTRVVLMMAGHGRRLVLQRRGRRSGRSGRSGRRFRTVVHSQTRELPAQISHSLRLRSSAFARTDYNNLIRDAQAATRAAIQDGHQLLEVVRRRPRPPCARPDSPPSLALRSFARSFPWRRSRPCRGTRKGPTR